MFGGDRGRHIDLCSWLFLTFLIRDASDIGVDRRKGGKVEGLEGEAVKVQRCEGGWSQRWNDAKVER